MGKGLPEKLEGNAGKVVCRQVDVAFLQGGENVITGEDFKEKVKPKDLKGKNTFSIKFF